MAKKKRPEEHLDESWLLPYSDLMTLLLALFIVLAASSSADQGKLDQMSQVFQSFLLGGTGVMEYTAPSPVDESPDSPIMSTDELTDILEENKKNQLKEEMENLQEMKEKIDSYIEKQGLSLSLQTKLTEAGLLITISDLALFESGSAVVKDDAIPLAKEISGLLVMDSPRQIMVTGHTDNVPISTATFRSNWDLSAIRAINFLKIILENKKHDPINFSAIGYGEYRPIEDNKTAEGRKHNRRVEVMILPNTDNVYLPIDKTD